MHSNPKRYLIIGIVVFVFIITMSFLVYRRITLDNEVAYPWSIGPVSPTLEKGRANDVVLSLQEGSLTRYGASFTIYNNGRIVIPLGVAPFFLQIEVNGIWNEIDARRPFLNAVWRLPLNPLYPSESRDLSFNWENMYGVLPDGTYRLVISLGHLNPPWEGAYLTYEFAVFGH